MNDFGNFLYDLRKEKGITQAELAEMLGVTNKAVSKWETGEAMPETSLLLPLSKILGVSVDELLSGKRNSETKIEQGENKQRYLEEYNSGEDTKLKEKNLNNEDEEEDEEPKTLLDKICGVVCACVVLIGLATYLFIGGFKDLWHPYWVIVPVSALSCGIISLVFELFDTEKNKYKIAKGENPYTGAICGIVMLTCIIAYLILGALLNLWHPYWIIVVCGAVTCGILGTVGDVFVYKNKNKKDNTNSN